MEEMASLWSHQKSIDELKLRIHYTALELEAVKAKANEEMNKHNESVKQLLYLLKLVCHERDEARDQIHKLQMKIMPSLNNPIISNCIVTDQVHQHHQNVTLMKPVKANSISIGESNSISDAYNHSLSPVDSIFHPVTSPEFGDINTNTSFVQDYQDVILSNALGNVPKIDPTMLMMENMIKGKALPQKGNLYKAVMEAGPLLQTLLARTGPLPNWTKMTPSLPLVSSGAHNQITLMMKQSQPLSIDDANYGNYNQRKMVVGSPRSSSFGLQVEKRQRFQ